jgi:hypothetical protein
LSVRGVPTERFTTLPAVVASATSAPPHEAGLLVPKMTAASSARAMASSSSGRMLPHTSNPASSNTASGIGTMVASSSTFRNLFDQSTSVVCFRPVSPLTKYAVGSAERTGIRVWLVAMRTCRNICRAADWLASPPRMSFDTCSGMSACALVLETRLLYGMSDLLGHRLMCSEASHASWCCGYARPAA